MIDTRASSLPGHYGDRIVLRILDRIGTDRVQIMGALIYPAFVAAVSVVVCAILMLSVAPEIVSIFETSDRPLPDLTLAVLAMSDWIGAHLVLLVWCLPRLRCRACCRRVWACCGNCAHLVLRLLLARRLKRLSASVKYLPTLVLSSALAPMQSLIPSPGRRMRSMLPKGGPAETKEVIGRDLLSQMACSVVFIPPLVRPIRRPRPLFSRPDWTLCDVPSGRWRRSSLPFFAMPTGQASHDLRKNSLVAPPLPAVVKRLVRTIFFRRIEPL